MPFLGQIKHSALLGPGGRACVTPETSVEACCTCEARRPEAGSGGIFLLRDSRSSPFPLEGLKGVTVVAERSGALRGFVSLLDWEGNLKEARILVIGIEVILSNWSNGNIEKEL